jgi:hypothetical protein
MDERLKLFSDRIITKDKLIYGVTTPEEVSNNFAEIAEIVNKLLIEEIKKTELILIHYPDFVKHGTMVGDGYKAIQLNCCTDHWMESGYMQNFCSRLKKILPAMVESLVAGVKDHKFTRIYTLELPMGVIDSRHAGISRLVTAYNINIDDYFTRIDIIGA